jgi:hypothetical protein
MIFALVVAIFIHELIHFMVYAFQRVQVLIFSCIFISIANKKIVLKFVGISGGNTINIIKSTNDFGKEKTKRKIIINHILTNVITLVFAIVSLLLPTLFSQWYIRVFWVALFVALIFIFFGSFTSYGDFHTAFALSKKDIIYLRYVCNNEIILGYNTDSYNQVVEYFINGADNMNIYVFANYVLNYCICNNEEYNAELIKIIADKIKLTPDSYRNIITDKINIYKYLSYEMYNFIADDMTENEKFNKRKTFILDFWHKLYLPFEFYRHSYNEICQKIFFVGELKQG